MGVKDNKDNPPLLFYLSFAMQDKFGLWVVSLVAKLPKTEADIARVDKTALFIFSSSFIIFNMFYWSNMLTQETF